MSAQNCSGYRNPGYVASLAEFGTPRELEASGGWILERSIPGSPLRDAMGGYPLFFCTDWKALAADLAQIQDLVSLALVTDPFGQYDRPLLESTFDRVAPFKEHFVIDLRQDPAVFITKHHRDVSRRSLRSVKVEVISEPSAFIDEWTQLYGHLVERHSITGVKAFSREAFAVQLGLPGLVALRAVSEGVTVAAHLWYVQGDSVYGHLAASNSDGYRRAASYALYHTAIQTFREMNGVRWMDLGAVAGAVGRGGGLEEFKRGWSTGSVPVYFCGKTFQKARYDELTRAANAEGTCYYPAYRDGEMER